MIQESRRLNSKNKQTKISLVGVIFNSLYVIRIASVCILLFETNAVNADLSAPPTPTFISYTYYSPFKHKCKVLYRFKVC